MPDSKYWLCDGTCGVSIGHIHYGQNVVLALGQELTPAMKVADELLEALKQARAYVLGEGQDYEIDMVNAAIAKAEGRES